MLKLPRRLRRWGNELLAEQDQLTVLIIEGDPEVAEKAHAKNLRLVEISISHEADLDVLSYGIAHFHYRQEAKLDRDFPARGLRPATAEILITES
jgi:hypothetical protein